MSHRSKQPETVGSLIAARRKLRRWSLERLAGEVECARSYLWMIERGQRGTPGEEILLRIEKALGFTPGELIAAARWESTPVEIRERMNSLSGKEPLVRRLAEILGESGIRKDGTVSKSLDRAHRSGELARLVNRLRPPQESRTDKKTRGREAKAPIDVPLINSVAAGYPREFTDLGYPARVADEYVRVPGLQDPDAFACRVVGDSMLPEYREGDIVVFSPLKAITDGKDCLARLEPDHETTFKRVYLERDAKGGEVIRLQPLNPVYPSRTVERERVAGLFAAVSVTRAVG
jgi:SOS-response transcriptional repressor LexA